MLNRDQILALGFKSEVVATRDGDFRVRVMSGAVREEFEAAMKREETSPTGTIRAGWLRWTVCDDAGALLFTDDDVSKLALLDADVLIQVFEAALRINGMGKNAVEAAEKN